MGDPKDTLYIPKEQKPSFDFSPPDYNALGRAGGLLVKLKEQEIRDRGGLLPYKDFDWPEPGETWLQKELGPKGIETLSVVVCILGSAPTIVFEGGQGIFQPEGETTSLELEGLPDIQSSAKEQQLDLEEAISRQNKAMTDAEDVLRYWIKQKKPIQVSQYKKTIASIKDTIGINKYLYKLLGQISEGDFSDIVGYIPIPKTIEQFRMLSRASDYAMDLLTGISSDAGGSYTFRHVDPNISEETFMSQLTGAVKRKPDVVYVSGFYSDEDIPGDIEGELDAGNQLTLKDASEPFLKRIVKIDKTLSGIGYVKAGINNGMPQAYVIKAIAKNFAAFYEQFAGETEVEPEY